MRLACGWARVGPEHPAHPARGFAGERVGWVGVDAGGCDLGMAKDALDDVHVHVLFPEQGSGRVPGVVRPGVFGDAGFGQERLPFLPVVMRVDRAARWLAPDEVPFLPNCPRLRLSRRPAP